MERYRVLRRKPIPLSLESEVFIAIFFDEQAVSGTPSEITGAALPRGLRDVSLDQTDLTE